MYISNIITSGLNMYRLLKISSTKFNLNMWVIKPLISAIAACIACSIISDYVIIPNLIIGTSFKIGVICGLYMVILFLFGIIQKESIEKIFSGRRVKAQK